MQPRLLRRFSEITRKIARTKPWKHSNERLNCSPGHLRAFPFVATFLSHQSTRFSCFLQCEETRQAVSIGPLSFPTAPESLSCEPLRLDLLVFRLLRNMPSTEIVRSHILHELHHTSTRETWSKKWIYRRHSSTIAFHVTYFFVSWQGTLWRLFAG